MNRVFIRTVAVAIGLGLGWLAAGHVGPAASYAETPEAHAEAGAEADDGHDERVYHGGHDGEVADGEHAADSGAADEAHDAHGDHAPDSSRISADELVPDAAVMSWYRPVVAAIIGLFVLAVLIGVPALALKGPDPPEPADHH